MSLKNWCLLLLVQSVWAASYIFMKFAVAEMPVGSVLFLRYGFTSACFVVFWLVKGLPKISLSDLKYFVALGALNFALAPAMQVKSLTMTQATDVSIMIAFEPILTVLVAAILLRERPGYRTWVTLTLATLGMFMLSGLHTAFLQSTVPLRLLGNLLFLASLTCESAVTVSGKPFSRKYPPHVSVGLMMLFGFLVGTAFNFPSIANTSFNSLSMKAWISVAVLALGCSIFAYTVWYRVIGNVPVSHVALSLYIQPIVGSFLGILVLNERLDATMFLGAIVIMSSLLYWQLRMRAEVR